MKINENEDRNILSERTPNLQAVEESVPSYSFYEKSKSEVAPQDEANRASQSVDQEAMGSNHSYRDT